MTARRDSAAARLPPATSKLVPMGCADFSSLPQEVGGSGVPVPYDTLNAKTGNMDIRVENDCKQCASKKGS